MLPLIAHVVYRFDVGGLENGVVNLVNRMPAFRHAIVALTEVTDFKKRITRDDVQFISLHKGPGQGYKLFPKLYRCFRDLKPDIVHTRNIGPLEAVVPAWAARVPVRIHGEHGWDVSDPDGSNQLYRLERRLLRPFVSHYIPLSQDIQRYLHDKVGVPDSKLAQIYNGVDAQLFRPAADGRQAIAGCPFTGKDLWLIGTVGRMKEIKDQTNLARAFCRLLELAPELHSRLRLVMIGEGPLRQASQDILAGAGLAELSWLPGERNDVAKIMAGLDCFVLPSKAEGVSNTILEAMASGLPVVATAVGGNGELVRQGLDGLLVKASDPAALAEAILDYARAPEKAAAAGRSGRERVEQNFSLEAMVASYQGLYEHCLSKSNLSER